MTDERPNVVLITSHDLGQHLGCYGVSTVRTPNLDALASDGVRLTNSWAAAPQCSPSRAAICTGRYPHSNGVMGLAHRGFGWDLRPDERPLAQLMRDEGWSTALFGLQHESPSVERLGFDRIVSPPPAECTVVGDGVRDFLDDRPAGGPPFYLQVGFFEPHRPFEIFDTAPDDRLGVTVPPYLVDDEDSRRECAALQGAVHKVDAAFGAVVAALESAGLSERTLVIATTDHGLPFPRAKCSLYDPGLCVFSIWRMPGAGICGGREVGESISNVDYLPTVLELCGIEAPTNVQGRSFAPALRGEAYQPVGQVFAEMTYHDYFDPRRCIRTDSHKLIVNFSTAPFFMDPSQDWRPATITRSPADPTRAYHPPVELYDLLADPLEEENLADLTESQPVRNELVQRLAAWMSDTCDPLIDGIPLSPMHEQAMGALGFRD